MKLEVFDGTKRQDMPTYLKLVKDGDEIHVMTAEEYSEDEWYLISFRPDGTFYRWNGVGSNNFQTNDQGQIVERD